MGDRSRRERKRITQKRLPDIVTPACSQATSPLEVLLLTSCSLAPDLSRFRNQFISWMRVFFFFFFNFASSLKMYIYMYIYMCIYIYIWLCQVLVVTHGMWHMGSLVVSFKLSCGMWDLVSWPGIKPGPLALEAQSLSHWTTREVLDEGLFNPILPL